MTTAGTTAVPRLRLGTLLWTGATLGAVAVTVGLLPRLSADMPLPGPLWLIMIAGVCQSGLLIALAVWAGVTLAPPVGLRAPAFEAAALRQPILPALKPQLLPGLIVGLPGGLLLFTSLRLSPAPIAAIQDRFTPPLHARVLYGGITEEVLLRWGLMTVFTWLAWRFVQRGSGAVNARLVWLAIAVSAILFGAGHLPMARFLLGSLNVPIVFFVIGLNAAFGLLFGWLYWRRGLESAMVAHAVTHLVAYAAAQIQRSMGAA